MMEFLVCTVCSDKSASGHSLTVRETVEVTSTEISGATAFEVSGNISPFIYVYILGVVLFGAFD